MNEINQMKKEANEQRVEFVKLQHTALPTHKFEEFTKDLRKEIHEGNKHLTSQLTTLITVIAAVISIINAIVNILSKGGS